MVYIRPFVSSSKHLAVGIAISESLAHLAKEGIPVVSGSIPARDWFAKTNVHLPRISEVNELSSPLAPDLKKSLSKWFYRARSQWGIGR